MLTAGSAGLVKTTSDVVTEEGVTVTLGAMFSSSSSLGDSVTSSELLPRTRFKKFLRIVGRLNPLFLWNENGDLVEASMLNRFRTLVGWTLVWVLGWDSGRGRTSEGTKVRCSVLSFLV